MNIDNEVRCHKLLPWRQLMLVDIFFVSCLDSEASVSQGSPCE